MIFAALSQDMDAQKRQEYEEWMRNQEREQQMMEYDCSVKYEEKASEVRQQQTQQTMVQTMEVRQGKVVISQTIRL